MTLGGRDGWSLNCKCLLAANSSIQLLWQIRPAFRSSSRDPQQDEAVRRTASRAGLPSPSAFALALSPSRLVVMSTLAPLLMDTHSLAPGSYAVRPARAPQTPTPS